MDSHLPYHAQSDLCDLVGMLMGIQQQSYNLLACLAIEQGTVLIGLAGKAFWLPYFGGPKLWLGIPKLNKGH